MRKELLLASALLLAAVPLTRGAGAPQDPELPPGYEPEDIMKMMQLAQPGPEHEELASLVGEWDMKIEVRTMPGADPMASTAKVSGHTILGGRFVELVTTGEVMGQPFESRSILGFDRRHEEYTCIGLDTLGTYWVTAKGKKGDNGVIRMHGSDDDLMGEQIYTFEYEIGEDEHTYRVLFHKLGPQEFDEPFAMVTGRSNRRE